MILHPVILAGGSGTRLWPLSRRHIPKQFLPLTGQHTLLQETLSRLDGMQGVAAPVVVCNKAHRRLVSDQVDELGRPTSALVLEPEGRNTAPALALASLALTQFADDPIPDPVMIVMPADHVVGNVQAFQAAVHEGARLAEEGYLVTFGVAPTSPQAGYGYLQKGQPLGDRADRKASPRPSAGTAPLRLLAFIEKPNAATAKAFLESDQYLWNSGIFMMRASVWLGELQRYRPDILEACEASLARAQRDGHDLYPSAEVFTACPSESIDYAVMEKAAAREQQGLLNRSPDTGPEPSRGAAGCAVVCLDAGWSDLGAWSAVWEEGSRDVQGNVLQGDVYVESVKDSLLIAQDRLLAVVGLQDMVVIETADAVLVAHKDRVQEVKEVVDRLKAEGRPER